MIIERDRAIGDIDMRTRKALIGNDTLGVKPVERRVARKTPAKIWQAP